MNEGITIEELEEAAKGRPWSTMIERKEVRTNA